MRPLEPFLVCLVFTCLLFALCHSDDSDEESAVVKVTKRSRKGGLVEKVNSSYNSECVGTL